MENNSKQFVNKWESQDKTKSFWLDFLSNVLNIDNAESYIEFDKSITYNGKIIKSIAGYMPNQCVWIEQRDQMVDLNEKVMQADGTMKTPFEQAKEYSRYLKEGYIFKPQTIKWIIVSNFKVFHIHNMTRPDDEPVVIKLADLENNLHQFDFMNPKRLAEKNSIKAARIIGNIYNEIINKYGEPKDESDRQSINQFCVRLVFCLFADDAGIFRFPSTFRLYMSKFKTKDWRKAMRELFDVLNTPIDERVPYLDEALREFPYIGGKLFENSAHDIPDFNDQLVDMILNATNKEFNWSEIHPTIFGALFESILNPQTPRHEMYYTPVENIHKLFDTLTLNTLQDDLKYIQNIQDPMRRIKEAKKFRNQLTDLMMIDPYCDSIAFLVEAYLFIRHLENEALKIINEDFLQLEGEIKVSFNQFYGFNADYDIVSVAKLVMWMAEYQMQNEVMDILLGTAPFLPLKPVPNIIVKDLPENGDIGYVPDEFSYYINPNYIGDDPKDYLQFVPTDGLYNLDM